eukprot:TRINITY_DN1060_c1_g1_i1.p1 TRINITY_DN1060_c1_g1~~TRINITY_DN1060_c1_g1_i1.p1  ORF type:complete len:676 (-),score=238.32 TRINITY_DN1060_c1_g1_i1:95-2122(-)
MRVLIEHGRYVNERFMQNLYEDYALLRSSAEETDMLVALLAPLSIVDFSLCLKDIDFDNLPSDLGFYVVHNSVMLARGEQMPANVIAMEQDDDDNKSRSSTSTSAMASREGTNPTLLQKSAGGSVSASGGGVGDFDGLYSELEQMISKDQEIERLKQQLQEKESVLAVYASSASAKQAEPPGPSVLSLELEKRVSELEADRSRLECESAAKDKEIGALNDKVREAEEQAHKEAAVFQEKIVAARAEAAAGLQEELGALKSKFHEREAELKLQQQLQNSGASEQASAAAAAIASTKSENDRLQESVRKLTVELDQANARNQKAENEFEEKKRALALDLEAKDAQILASMQEAKAAAEQHLSALQEVSAELKAQQQRLLEEKEAAHQALMYEKSREITAELEARHAESLREHAERLRHDLEAAVANERRIANEKSETVAKEAEHQQHIRNTQHAQLVQKLTQQLEAAEAASRKAEAAFEGYKSDTARARAEMEQTLQNKYDTIKQQIDTKLQHIQNATNHTSPDQLRFAELEKENKRLKDSCEMAEVVRQQLEKMLLETTVELDAKKDAAATDDSFVLLSNSDSSNNNSNNSNSNSSSAIRVKELEDQLDALQQHKTKRCNELEDLVRSATAELDAEREARAALTRECEELMQALQDREKQVDVYKKILAASRAGGN